METDRQAAYYRRLYSKLLRLYPQPYRKRFGESMEQTFHDLCQERTGAGEELFSFALQSFGETSIGIFKERISFLLHTMRTKNLSVIAIVTVLILMVPLIAMQFNTGVDWDLFDFVFAGVLIFGTGLAYELVAKRGGSTAYRAAVCAALSGVFLIIWVNAAVGLIGNENNPLNLLYFGVIAIGVIGAMIARLRPRGMSRALFVTTAAQMAVPVIAFLIGRPSLATAEDLMGVAGTFVISTFFALPFVISALLFRSAGQKQGGSRQVYSA